MHKVVTQQRSNCANADFERLRELIYAESGINLSSDKKTMLEIRLKRRDAEPGYCLARRLLRPGVRAQTAWKTNWST